MEYIVILSQGKDPHCRARQFQVCPQSTAKTTDQIKMDTGDFP